jgi:hypothetical protein
MNATTNAGDTPSLDVLWAQWRGIKENTPPDAPDSTVDRYYAAVETIERQIVGTPARTIQDVEVKLALFRHHLGSLRWAFCADEREWRLFTDIEAWVASRRHD